MNYNYEYEVHHIGENGEGFMATIPKFKNLHVFGDTVGELHEIVQECIEMELEERRRKKKGIPVTDENPVKKGYIKVSLPPKLLNKVFSEAKENKTRPDKFIERTLEEKVGFQTIPK